MNYVYAYKYSIHGNQANRRKQMDISTKRIFLGKVPGDKGSVGILLFIQKHKNNLDFFILKKDSI